jgi:nicotinate-nucleotide adenylyltransferase
VGVFGGAFDPPHLAHRALLEDAVWVLGLDAVHVVPTGQAWHKPRVLTSPEHRLAMAQLAFGDLPRVTIDRLEIDRNGPSYTIDTLHHIAQAEPGAELFLMMGADQAAALMSWRAWQEILQIAIICVADRAHHASASAIFDAEKLFPERFLHLDLPAMHLSATQIRSSVSTGQSVQTLVSEPVARYIADHHLYRLN